MTAKKKSGLDAVDDGPQASDATKVGQGGPSGDPNAHVSVKGLMEKFPDAVVRHCVNAGDQHVVWVDPTRSLEILTWLKDDAGQLYDMMTDVTAIDYGGGRPVNVVYQMFSTTHKHSLRIRCELPLDVMEIASVANLWKSADWLEREVYDLFGVDFKGHPDLRRILMPQDYAEGHPLRKDFPLRGRFSRAEQTRRALNQEVDRFYVPDVLEHAGEPQEVPEVGAHATDVWGNT